MSKITKAILTGGGRATRLRPITTNFNKHLIPLANQPMIFHAINKAVAAGIKEIFINVNPDETELQKVVGTGERWGIKITFFVQTGGPQGIAHVVKCAERFVGNSPFMFYLSDNIIFSDLSRLLQKFNEDGLDALMTLSKVNNPAQFGVPRFNNRGEIVEVLEKPPEPPSNLAVTGIYLFNNYFFEAFKHITKSARGEYEIPSIFTYLIKNNYKVGHEEITGWWKDTGTPGDLLKVNKLLLDKMPANFFSSQPIPPGNNKIINPVIVGNNCMLENCVIGPDVAIGDGSNIKNAVISNTIIFSNVSIDGAKPISNSIISSTTLLET